MGGSIPVTWYLFCNGDAMSSFLRACTGGASVRGATGSPDATGTLRDRRHWQLQISNRPIRPAARPSSGLRLAPHPACGSPLIRPAATFSPAGRRGVKVPLSPPPFSPREKVPAGRMRATTDCRKFHPASVALWEYLTIEGQGSVPSKQQVAQAGIDTAAACLLRVGLLAACHSHTCGKNRDRQGDEKATQVIRVVVEIQTIHGRYRSQFDRGDWRGRRRPPGSTGSRVVTNPIRGFVCRAGNLERSEDAHTCFDRDACIVRQPVAGGNVGRDVAAWQELLRCSGDRRGLSG